MGRTWIISRSSAWDERFSDRGVRGAFADGSRSGGCAHRSDGLDVTLTNDIFKDERGLLWVTDKERGLDVIEYEQ